MTDEEILSLRHGDVILIDRGERSYYRTVIEGPGDETEPNRSSSCGVCVPIMKRSWTGRIKTVLDREFLRKNAIYTGIRAKKLMGGDELSRLIDRGWNVAKEILRELREEADLKARRGYSRLKTDRCHEITRRLVDSAKEYRGLR